MYKVLSRQSIDSLPPYVTGTFCFVWNCYLDLFIDVEGPIESGHIAILAGEEQKEQLLKQKISENASAIPVVLTRMKECMKRIDKLQSCNGVIHPAFKRKRTYWELSVRYCRCSLGYAKQGRRWQSSHLVHVSFMKQSRNKTDCSIFDWLWYSWSSSQSVALLNATKLMSPVRFFQSIAKAF